MPEEQKQGQQRIQIQLPIPTDPLVLFLADPNRPAFYANGFNAGTTATECFFIFTQNNIPKVAVTLPLPAVLSLRNACENLIKGYEKQFDVHIKAAEELGNIIVESNKQKDKI